MRSIQQVVKQEENCVAQINARSFQGARANNFKFKFFVMSRAQFTVAFYPLTKRQQPRNVWTFTIFLRNYEFLLVYLSIQQGKF